MRSLLLVALLLAAGPSAATDLLVCGNGGWRLTGTWVGSDFERAIVRAGGGDERAVAPGEWVGACRVQAVTEQHMVVARDGMTYRVRLGAGGTDHPALSMPMPEYRYVHLRRERMRDLMTDRQRLVGEVSLEPAVHDGFLAGYRIAWLKPGGELQGLGLAAGDEIVAVNGAPVNQPGTLSQVMGGLGDVRAVNLDLRRGDEEVSLVYVLE